MRFLDMDCNVIWIEPSMPAIQCMKLQVHASSKTVQLSIVMPQRGALKRCYKIHVINCRDDWLEPKYQQSLMAA